jgi:hypothetical protein
MTPGQLALLSQAHAVAYVAMAAGETRAVPMAAAFALREAAAVEFPEFAPSCTRFVEHLRASRGVLPPVVAAGRVLRDAVCDAMVFVPVDHARVDVHG